MAIQTQSVPINFEKVCTKCGDLKSIFSFNKSKLLKDGFAGWCKVCSGKAVSAWSKKNKANNRAKLIKHRYGITQADFQIMFERQAGCCAICSIHQSEQKRTLSIDHDHKTNKVQELLCDLCNRALGYMQDDPLIIRAALDYLERHDAN